MPRDGVTHPTLDTAPPTDTITSVAFEFLQLERAAESRYLAMCEEPDDGSEDDDPELTRIHTQQGQLLATLCGLRANGKDDITTKVRVLDSFGGTYREASETTYGLGAAGLVRSLIFDILVTKVERTLDGEILHLGELHREAAEKAEALNDQDEDDLSAQAYYEMHAIEDKIVGVRAETLDGLLVKAKVLNRMYAVAEDDLTDETIFHQAFCGVVPLGSDQMMIGSITRDLAALAEKAP